MASKLSVKEINSLILDNESNPYKLPDGSTYINGDYHLAIMEQRIDLKMLRCIVWSRNPEYDASPEELYSISPDYFGDRKICYGMGKNKITNDHLYLPSPDHKIPLVHGGAKTIDNLVIVPLKYNIWKRDILKEDWINFREFMNSHLDCK
jgi:hypothetical protein